VPLGCLLLVAPTAKPFFCPTVFGHTSSLLPSWAQCPLKTTHQSLEISTPPWRGLADRCYPTQAGSGSHNLDLLNISRLLSSSTRLERTGNLVSASTTRTRLHTFPPGFASRSAGPRQSRTRPQTAQSQLHNAETRPYSTALHPTRPRQVAFLNTVPLSLNPYPHPPCPASRHPVHRSLSLYLGRKQSLRQYRSFTSSLSLAQTVSRFRFPVRC
jgi:hypothetical protein